MSFFANFVGSAKQYLAGHSQTQEEAAPDDEAAQEDEVVIVEEGDLGSAKRKAGQSETQKHKRRRISEEEQRLTGNCNKIPKNFHAIEVPRNQDDDSPPVRREAGLEMPPKLKSNRGRGIQPTNTLHQQQTGRPGTPNSKLQFQHSKRAKYGLDVQPSRGSNVPSARTARGGDGFEDNERGALKRRKTEHNTIALDDLPDISYVGTMRTTKVNGHDYKPVDSQESNVSRRLSSHNDDWFKPMGRDIDALTSFKPDKRRRIQSSSQSNGNSVRSVLAKPSAPLLRGRDAMRAGTRNSPLSVDDDNSQPQKTTAKRQRPQPSDLNQRPNITLRDVTANEELKRDPREFNEDESSNFMKRNKPLKNRSKLQEYSGASSLASHDAGDQRQKLSAQHSQADARNLHDQSRVTSPASRVTERAMPRSSAQHGQVGPQRLNDQFVRDNEPPLKQHQKARERMQPEQQAQPTKKRRLGGSLSSADELSRETTIRSQGTPKEIHGQTPREEYRRPPSPSDLKQTNFAMKPPVKQISKPSRSTSSSDSELSSDEEDDKKMRIPIKSIYARCGMLSQEGLCLTWVLRDKCFYLENDKKEPVRIIGKSRCFTLSSAEATTWTGNRDSFAVLIKGGRTEHSLSSIVITFESHKGKDDCYNNLLYATNDMLKHKEVGEEQLNKLINKQMADIVEDCEKLQDMAETAQTAAILKQQGQQRAGYKETEASLGSMHVSASAYARYAAASRMQASTEATPETSKYFDQPAVGDSTRRSTRQPRVTRPKTPTPPPPERWTEVHRPQRWSHSVLYPPDGAKRVTVDFPDLERLDEGEFLNDNLISLALRRVEENMQPQHRDKVHFFNSFFYTALMTKNGRKTFNYDGVKKWTKNKDLLSTPYIVVPINIDLHWFVAIICNLPNLARKTSIDEDAPGDDNTGSSSPAREEETAVPDSQENNKVGDQIQAMDGLTLDEDQDRSRQGSEIFTFGDDGQVANESNAERTTDSADRVPAKRTKNKAGPPPKKFDPEQPIIITLDSFGSPHSAEVGNLKKYIVHEADDKRSMKLQTNEMMGMTAKGLPEQTNFCDCGVFLAGYVEQFAKDPEAFVRRVLTRKLDEANDFASFDPSAKRAELRTFLLGLQEEQDAARKAAKREKQAKQKSEVKPTVNAAPLPAVSVPSISQEAARNFMQAFADSAQVKARHVETTPAEPSIATSEAPPAEIAVEAPKRNDEDDEDSIRVTKVEKPGEPEEPETSDDLDFEPARPLAKHGRMFGADREAATYPEEDRPGSSSSGTDGSSQDEKSDRDEMLDNEQQQPGSQILDSFGQASQVREVDLSPLDGLENALTSEVSPVQDTQRASAASHSWTPGGPAVVKDSFAGTLGRPDEV